MSEPEPGPIDWEAIDLILMTKRGIKPWELDRLTVAEVCILLEDETKRRAPSGRTPMGPDEIQAYARRMRSMTTLEKLQAAREGKL